MYFSDILSAENNILIKDRNNFTKFLKAIFGNNIL